MTSARGDVCGLWFREAFFQASHFKSHCGSVLPPRCWCELSFRCSGVARLSLVVSVSGKRQWENVKMEACWSEGLLMFSTSWVIAMDCYVIIALCCVLQLGCCAMIERVGGWKEMPVQTMDHCQVQENRSLFGKWKCKKEDACYFERAILLHIPGSKMSYFSVTFARKTQATQKSEQRNS